MQLAMVARLMAICSNKPILIIAPKTLLSQWQNELLATLHMPTAYWNGKRWIEGEHEYPIFNDGIKHGLNLQTLGTLINLDLPWNPTRLEQRKGRIQRGGQKADVVDIFNMRYQDSIEDRVHKVLSKRLKQITAVFGQIPDTLEDLWIEVALGNASERDLTERFLDVLPAQNPFKLKYDNDEKMLQKSWVNVTQQLNPHIIQRALLKGW